MKTESSLSDSYFSGQELSKGSVDWGTRLGFFNPFQCLAQGKWYWQYAYVTPGGKEEWSPVYQFHIGKDTPEFNPPTLEKVLAKYTSHHPRVLLDADDWEEIITKNKIIRKLRPIWTKLPGAFLIR